MIGKLAVFGVKLIHQFVKNERRILVLSYEARTEDLQFMLNAFRFNHLFGASIENQLEAQKTSFPHCKVPIVFNLLCEVICRNGGLSAVGIFRKSPGLAVFLLYFSIICSSLFLSCAACEEVARLKQQLDSGNMDVESLMKKFPSPHTSALALKIWFAEMDGPVIPRDMYHSCINVVKKEGLLRSSMRTRSNLTFVFNSVKRRDGKHPDTGK